MDALEAAYAVSQVLEAEAMLVDSDTNSSSSGSSSSSSSDEEMQPSRSETILDDMADLYSRHYLNERRDIPKTQDNLHLLLHTYKDDFPDIFRSYVPHLVALWAGVGYGTVNLVTKRVMTAICREEFRRSTLHWPNDAEKEAARAWVEENSCPGWRGGWLMVDGTLVPLYARPGFFGNTWFDRKSNYSMNVQSTRCYSMGGDPNSEGAQDPPRPR
ncbi:hypothetical protein FIBSPDRAFT_881291 [Athelia psychrophila]|uniref:DDE Tnp4 domain-containing protein n=1 Tax=Athelia psychrophila TaxID=1759441 RepID=A0A166WHP4_9AGAM|nr:hypothetical protein FIBSPDRAFT_881291 [Fibularhizoctonia sp. CBS 109695]